MDKTFTGVNEMAQNGNLKPKLRFYINFNIILNDLIIK